MSSSTSFWTDCGGPDRGTTVLALTMELVEQSLEFVVCDVT